MNVSGHDKSVRPAGRARVAFTLVELVMVVSIIGIVTAIAVPRMSGAASRAGASSLEASVANVRKAVDVYYAEHAMYPGYDPAAGKAPDGGKFVDQLLMYTDAQGNTNANYGNPFLYGPYLRPPFPTNPTNTLKTVHVKAAPQDADPAEGSVGWVAVLSHGYFGISASDSDLDDAGVDPGKRALLRAK